MNAVASGVGADQEDAVTHPLGSRPHQLIGTHEPDAHRVHERVVRVAVFEVDLAADRRNSHAVAVAADPGHDAFEVAAGFGQRAKAQRVEQRDGPCAHRDHVPDDAADPGGRTLVWLDRGGVVVGFDLEDHGPALADAHRPGVFARSLKDRRPGRGEPPEQGLRALVRAVLRPEHTEHAKLDLVGGSLQLLDDDPVLIRGERDFPKPSLIHRFDAQDTRTFSALSATDRNSFNPSVPPSSASEQRSG